MNPRKDGRDGLYSSDRTGTGFAEPASSFEADLAARGAAPKGDGGSADLKPAPRSALYEPPKSTVDRHSSFDGKYESESDLQVQGVLMGEITCQGTLTIEAEARVKAQVQAAAATILGTFEGDLVCAGKLTIGATAQVSGTLKAGVLVIEEGATVQATVDTTAGAAVAGALNGDAKRKDAAAAPTSIARAVRREPSFAMVAPAEDRPPLDRP